MALAVGGGPGAQALKTGSGKGGVKLKRVGRFRGPVYASSAPGSPGLYVVEQGGRVKVVVNGHERHGPFLDIRKFVRLGTEQGLLSIAFPPDYHSSRRFYVYYTNNAGDNVVAEFRRSPGRHFRAKRKTRRIVLTIPHPGFPNHNGGQIQFGPGGFLFIGPGDGGGAGDTDNSAQTTDNLAGKLLRIDPRRQGSRPYTSPAGNPFSGAPGRDEIFAIGLRNPFRFSFDRVTKPKQPRIVIGDVGQDTFEEVDYETLAHTKGANFGWNDFEGFKRFSGAIAPAPAHPDRPILAYRHKGNRCAIIGGYVVHDRSLRNLYGRYIYGDLCKGEVRSLVPGLKRAKRDRRVSFHVPLLSSFGEGRGGALYAMSLYGSVYRVVPRGR